MDRTHQILEMLRDFICAELIPVSIQLSKDFANNSLSEQKHTAWNDVGKLFNTLSVEDRTSVASFIDQHYSQRRCSEIAEVLKQFPDMKIADMSQPDQDCLLAQVVGFGIRHLPSEESRNWEQEQLSQIPRHLSRAAYEEKAAEIRNMARMQEPRPSGELSAGATHRA